MPPADAIWADAVWVTTRPVLGRPCPPCRRYLAGPRPHESHGSLASLDASALSGHRHGARYGPAADVLLFLVVVVVVVLVLLVVGVLRALDPMSLVDPSTHFLTSPGPAECAKRLNNNNDHNKNDHTNND